MLKRIYLLLFLTLPVFAVECDIPISFNSSTNAPITFNNKGKACYNWQFSFSSSGFTVVSLTVQSGADAGQVPGAFSTWAGSILTGANPLTSVTTATTTFSGYYPYVRITPTTLTGTGLVTGRLIGSVLSAPNFASNGVAQFFGRITLPNDALFTWDQQGPATVATATDGGVVMTIGQGGATSKFSSRCGPSFPAAPWTYIAGLMPGALQVNSIGQWTVSVFDGTTDEEFDLGLTGTLSGTVNSVGFFRCNTNTRSCSTIDGTNFFAFNGPVSWVKFVDDGAGTRTLSVSSDNVQWNTRASFAYSSASVVATKGCWGINSLNNNNTVSAKLISWSVTSP